MFNSRPLDNPKTQECLDRMKALFLEYDLAGAAVLISETDMGFTYQLPTSFNAIYTDPAMPMGLRIRAKSAEGGHAEAHRKITGAAQVFTGLSDFGAMTYKWANDFLQILQRQGIQITHTPFGGKALGTIKEYPAPQSRRRR